MKTFYFNTLMKNTGFSIDSLKYNNPDDTKTKKINTMIKNALNDGWTITKKINKHCFELTRKRKEPQN